MTVVDIQKTADAVWKKIENTQPFIDLIHKMVITGDKETDKRILKTVCDIAVGETIRVINEPSTAQALHFNQYD